MPTNKPVKPKVVGSRPYTGNSDPATGPRAGTDEFIRRVVGECPALWNNGSYGQRNMRGDVRSLSVHACGRAVDFSYRHMPDKGIVRGRRAAMPFVNMMLAHANDLGIEMVLDYLVKPFGRGWRCDRQRWSKYSKKTISGAPGGDWFHIEINPAMADNPAAVKAAWVKVFPEIHC